MSLRRAIAILAPLWLTVPAWATFEFTSQKLDSSDPSLDVRGRDVNSSNIVVGDWYFVDNGNPKQRGFVWKNSQNGIQVLGTLGGSSGYRWTYANAINNQADPMIVGKSRNSNGTYKAFYLRYSDINTLTQLGNTTFSWDSEATNCNDSGTVVGWGRITSSTGPLRAFRWASSTMTNLGTLSGGNESSANAVSSSTGDVVGYSTNSSGNQRPVKWVHGSGTNFTIGALSTPGWTEGEALDINANGDICGKVWNGGTTRACVWWGGTNFQLIPGLENASSSARSMNDAGVIVGRAAIGPGGAYRGFIYGQGTLYNAESLPGLGGYPNGSRAITELNGVSNSATIPAFAGVGQEGANYDAVLVRIRRNLITSEDLAIGSVSIVGPNPIPANSTTSVRLDISYQALSDQRGSALPVQLALRRQDGSTPSEIWFEDTGTQDLFSSVSRVQTGIGNFSVRASLDASGQTYYVRPVMSEYYPSWGQIWVSKANSSIGNVSAPNGQYYQAANLSATLYRQDGNSSVMQGRTLIWTWNGNGQEIGRATTNGSGAASFTGPVPTWLPTGVQGVTVRFDGDSAYNPSNAQTTINVSRASTSLQATHAYSTANALVPLQATLRRSIDSQPISGRSVTFAVSGYGTVGSGVTDANGVATVNWITPNGIPKGDNSLALTFAGDSVYDSSTTSGTLSISNSPPTASPAGTWLSFDQNGSYVQVPSGTYFAGDLTAEAWVYLRSYATWSRLFDFGNGPNQANVLVTLTDGSAGPPVYVGAGSTVSFVNTIPTTGVHHVAVTVQGTTVRTYVDGTQTNVASGVPVQNVVRNLCFIAKSNWDDPTADACIDEFRIWNYARSQSQIATDRYRHLASNTPGLLNYWTFDDGGGNNLTDIAGGKTGVLKNAPRWLPSGAPVDTYRVEFESATPVKLGGMDVDNDPLSYEVVQQPAHGTLTGTAPNLVYTPDPLFVGADAFTYRLNDGTTYSNIATIQLAVENQSVILPNSVSIVEGELYDGGLNEILSSDDAKFMAFNAADTLAAIVEVTGNGPSQLSELRVITETSVARTGLVFQIRLYRFSTSTWQVGHGSIGTLSDTTVDTGAVSQPNDYLGPNGLVKVQLKWYPVNDESPIQDGWIHSIDLVRWRIVP